MNIVKNPFAEESHQRHCSENSPLESNFQCDNCELKCDLCNKTFNLKNTYQIHRDGIYNEEGDANYKCDQCQSEFCTGKLLKTHYNMKHRKFDCDLCGKSFTLQSSLNIHIRNQIPVTCSACGKIECNQGALKIHKKKVHDCSKCKVCGVIYENINMARHMLWNHKMSEM